MPQPGQCFVGTLEREYYGRHYRSPVVLLCPGDWPRVLKRIPAAERGEWSTVRLGTHLLAVGPPTGPCLAWLEDVLDIRGTSDGVPTPKSRAAS